MRIRSNIPALYANRNTGRNNKTVSKALEKLSSGYKITVAADDASGLAISEKMRAQIVGLSTASSNCQDGISLIQTAEGALSETHSMLNRLVELATRSMNGTFEESDRATLDQEYQELLSEIEHIAKSTNYNGIPLLDGSQSSGSPSVTPPVTPPVIPPPPPPPSGTPITISGTGPFEIAADGVYEIAEGFTGTINIKAGAKVLLQQANPATALNEVSINCQEKAELYIKDLKIQNTVDSNIISFTGAGNSLNTIGENALSSTKISSTKSMIHAGAGTELSLHGTGKLSVVAPYGSYGAGIGGDKDEAGGAISILGGQVFARTSSNSFGAAIGGGDQGDGGTISILGGRVETNVGVDSRGAGIGGGRNGSGGSIRIDGGEVSAFTSWNSQGAGIGGGSGGNGGSIQIDGGRIWIYTGEKALGAGIGGGAFTDGGTIVMRGGMVTLTGALDALGAAIGGGSGCYERPPAPGKGADLTIYEGIINILNSWIGGGKDSDSIDYGIQGTVTVKGGTIHVPKWTPDMEVGTSHDPAVSGEPWQPTALSPEDRPPSRGIPLQIGAEGQRFNLLTLFIEDMTLAGLGLSGSRITNPAEAKDSLSRTRSAINQVSATRATLGTMQNRLEHTIANLGSTHENMTAAESQIRDADMAQEMMTYTKSSVLTQAAQAMLAQANQLPQGALQLLQ